MAIICKYNMCKKMKKKLVVKSDLLKNVLFTMSDQTSIAIMALSPVTTTETCSMME